MGCFQSACEKIGKSQALYHWSSRWGLKHKCRNGLHAKQNALSIEVAFKTGRFYSSITLLLHTWTTGLILSPYNVTIIRKSIGLRDDLCFPDLKQVVIALKMAETVNMDQLDAILCQQEWNWPSQAPTEHTNESWMGKKFLGKENLVALFRVCSQRARECSNTSCQDVVGVQQEQSSKKYPWKKYQLMSIKLLYYTFTFQKYSQVHEYLDWRAWGGEKAIRPRDHGLPGLSDVAVVGFGERVRHPSPSWERRPVLLCCTTLEPYLDGIWELGVDVRVQSDEQCRSLYM